MNKNRYVERKILCDYDLCEELFNKLNLKVYDMVPLRKVFLLITDQGKKILKRCQMSHENVQFIDGALNYIYLKDKNIMKYCKNKNNELITRWNEKEYIVLDMIEGREAAFTNPVEVLGCTKAIWKLHSSSNGLVDHLKSINIEAIYGDNIINNYIKDLNEISEIKKWVKKFKYTNEFDDIFLRNVDSIKRQMNKAIELLFNSSYEKMKKDKKNYCLCHNDLAHHNFIIDNDIVNLIDFDYCNIDLRIKDLYIFINKVIKNSIYEKDMVDNIILEYGNEGDTITNEEKAILSGFMCYPYDFVEIIKLYYNKQKSWDKEIFINRLKNKAEIDGFRVELVNKMIR